MQQHTQGSCCYYILREAPKQKTIYGQSQTKQHKSKQTNKHVIMYRHVGAYVADTQRSDLHSCSVLCGALIHYM